MEVRFIQRSTFALSLSFYFQSGDNQQFQFIVTKNKIKFEKILIFSEIFSYFWQNLNIYSMMGIEQIIKPGKLKECKKFGRMLAISPKAMVSIIESPIEFAYNTDTAIVSVTIGNHTGHLIMSKEAWEEFVSGGNVEIRTASDFKKAMTTNIKNKKS